MIVGRNRVEKQGAILDSLIFVVDRIRIADRL